MRTKHERKPRICSAARPKKGVERFTISLPPEVLAVGQRRAAAADRNFSNYIVCLIKRDAEDPAVSAQ